MHTKHILLAGATGYLGRFILRELLQQGYKTRVVVRNRKKLPTDLCTSPLLEVIETDLMSAESIRGICEGIDVILSTIGITKQQDGLTYMQVDYGVNK